MKSGMTLSWQENYYALPVGPSITDRYTLLFVVVTFLWLDIVDVHVDSLADELFTEESSLC
jgi:hypothetical protein